MEGLKWLTPPEKQPPIQLRSFTLYGLQDGDPVVDNHRIDLYDPQTGRWLGCILDVDGITPTKMRRIE